MQFLLKSKQHFPPRYRQPILKFIKKNKGTRTAERITKDKNKVRGITLPILRLTINLQQSNQYGIDEGIDIKIKRIELTEIPEIDPNKYDQLIFDKGARAIQ